MTEPGPQSKTPTACTRRDPPTNPPVKRTWLSEHDTAPLALSALLLTKRPPPPTSCQCCLRCFTIGCLWAEACPETTQQIMPVDFRRLLRNARRATERSNPLKQHRFQYENAEALATHMEIVPLPPISVGTVSITKGVAHVIPDAPVASGGDYKIDSVCQRPAVGICDQQECQLRQCEEHQVYMCETRFPI